MAKKEMRTERKMATSQVQARGQKSMKSRPSSSVVYTPHYRTTAKPTRRKP